MEKEGEEKRGGVQLPRRCQDPTSPRRCDKGNKNQKGGEVCGDNSISKKNLPAPRAAPRGAPRSGPPTAKRAASGAPGGGPRAPPPCPSAATARPRPGPAAASARGRGSPRASPRTARRRPPRRAAGSAPPSRATPRGTCGGWLHQAAAATAAEPQRPRHPHADRERAAKGRPERTQVRRRKKGGGECVCYQQRIPPDETPTGAAH